MSDLVKRLREACTNPSRDAMDIVDHWNLEDEAADAVERKDAAIAELVTALRAIEFEASPIHGDRGYHEKVYSLAIDALAKYDNE